MFDQTGNLKGLFCVPWFAFETTEMHICASESPAPSKSYDPISVSGGVKRLYADPYVKNRRGVFEYILGGHQDSKLLDVRVFDEGTKRAVYARQTAAAEADGTSNCPHCTGGHAANKNRIWKFAEMDADHVSAWSKGGATSPENCQMLCVTHNRTKGNR